MRDSKRASQEYLALHAIIFVSIRHLEKVRLQNSKTQKAFDYYGTTDPQWDQAPIRNGREIAPASEMEKQVYASRATAGLILRTSSTARMPVPSSSIDPGSGVAVNVTGWPLPMPKGDGSYRMVVALASPAP